MVKEICAGMQGERNACGGAMGMIEAVDACHATVARYFSSEVVLLFHPSGEAHESWSRVR